MTIVAEVTFWKRQEQRIDWSNVHPAIAGVWSWTSQSLGRKGRVTLRPFGARVRDTYDLDPLASVRLALAAADHVASLDRSPEGAAARGSVRRWVEARFQLGEAWSHGEYEDRSGQEVDRQTENLEDFYRLDDDTKAMVELNVQLEVVQERGARELEHAMAERVSLGDPDPHLTTADKTASLFALAAAAAAVQAVVAAGHKVLLEPEARARREAAAQAALATAKAAYGAGAAIVVREADSALWGAVFAGGSSRAAERRVGADADAKRLETDLALLEALVSALGR